LDIVKSIQIYVGDNYKDPNLTVESISQVVGFSTNYVRTIFKDYTGDSLTNFINNMRFNEVKRMLMNTNYPAKKIAENVGFASSRYFYTAFKKLTGKSPDEYRKIKLG